MLRVGLRQTNDEKCFPPYDGICPCPPYTAHRAAASNSARRQLVLFLVNHDDELSVVNFDVVVQPNLRPNDHIHLLTRGREELSPTQSRSPNPLAVSTGNDRRPSCSVSF